MRSKHLAGIMVQDISFDDFLDSCGLGRNPLMTAIGNALGIGPPVTVPNFVEETTTDRWTNMTNATNVTSSSSSVLRPSAGNTVNAAVVWGTLWIVGLVLNRNVLL